MTWGVCDYGRLGHGGASASSAWRWAAVDVLEPRPVALSLPPSCAVTAASCGEAHTLFLDSNGSAWATGFNKSGQLGIGNTSNTSHPQRIILKSPAASLSAGGAHSALVTRRGELFLCGSNKRGQLGLPECKEQSSLPLDISPVLDARITQAVCGSHHTLALTEDGHVYSWGSNLLGQLGHGRIPGMEETDSENRPRRVEELARHRVVRLFCGFDSCAAMTSDGAVFVWGGGRLGQLGLGRSNLRDVSLPVRHPSLTGLDIVALSFGVNHGACVHRNGTLQMWGSGFYQGFVLGQGGKSMASDVPVDVELPLPAADVACGETFVLAAAAGGGNLFSWGWGAGGRLGLGDDNDWWTPQPIAAAAGSRLKHVAAGRSHACSWA